MHARLFCLRGLEKTWVCRHISTAGMSKTCADNLYSEHISTIIYIIDKLRSSPDSKQ
jgi:hypothetical protein